MLSALPFETEIIVLMGKMIADAEPIKPYVWLSKRLLELKDTNNNAWAKVKQIGSGQKTTEQRIADILNPSG